MSSQVWRCVAHPQVSAVLVNYRTPSETLEAVASLKSAGYPRLGIIVVDNASGDGIEALLPQSHPDVHLILNQENVGFPAACNVGIRRALEMGADYVLLFNTDAQATPGMLEALVRAAESDPRVGIVGPAVLMEDGRTTWYRGGYFNSVLGYTKHPGMGRPFEASRARPVPTDFVTGCCMLIRRALLETIGLLEEGYFLYVDDVELSLRARRAGFRVVYCPQALARHRVSLSTGIPGTNVLTPLRAYYYARNMPLLIRKHLWGWRAWTALQGQIYVRAAYRLLTMVLDHQLRSVVPYMRGLWHGLMGITGKWEQHDRWTKA